MPADAFLIGLAGDAAGTAYGVDNHGNVWSSSGVSPWVSANGGLPGKVVSGLWADATHGGRVLAGTAAGGSAGAVNFGQGPLWMTANGGAAWQRSDAQFEATEIGEMAADPRVPAHVVASTANDGVRFSKDGGVSWRTSKGMASGALQLVYDPTRPRFVLAVAYDSRRLAQSTDGGATFALLSSTAGPLATDGAGTFFGIVDGHVAQSEDGGTTWQPLTDTGLPPLIQLGQITADRAVRGALWASTLVGLYHFAPGDAKWYLWKFDGQWVRRLAVDGGQVRTLYVSISAGGVYRSTDDGVSWARVLVGDYGALATAPGRQGSVVAAGAGGVVLSSDAGAHWAALPGLPGAPSRPPRLLAFDADQHTVYAGTSGFGVFARTPSYPPALVARPRISGKAVTGMTLRSTAGRVGGVPNPRLVYTWLRCDTVGERCRVIGGSHSRRYVVRAADEGHRLRMRLIATNSRGRLTVRSTPSPIVSNAAGTGSVGTHYATGR